jgi:hypothetical protein
LASTILSSCRHPAGVVVFPCPEVTEEMLSDPVLQRLPVEWYDWYRLEYDPYCDQVDRALRASQ